MVDPMLFQEKLSKGISRKLQLSTKSKTYWIFLMCFLQNSEISFHFIFLQNVVPTAPDSIFISNEVFNSSQQYPSPRTFNGQLGDNLFNSKGLTKTSDPNVSSAKPVTYSEHCESSPDCLIKHEQSKADQRCCCSQALRNLVHTMKGLHGELGSISVAIKNQGSQLEAVAHNLADLSASIRLLVGILPSLVQPVSSKSFLSPSGQDESQLQNQLPLK